MPIQACEAREKVIHCAYLSHQQKGQMLAQIINCPDRALPLFDVPEFLLADTLSAHLQGPPAGTVQLCVSCCADADAPPCSCCSQSRGGVLLLKLPEPVSHEKFFFCKAHQRAHLLWLQTLVIGQSFIAMLVITR